MRSDGPGSAPTDGRRQDPWSRLQSAAFRFLLKAFPRRFRELHGRDLLQAYLDSESGGGPSRRAPGIALDLLRNGVAARLDDLRSAPPDSGPEIPDKRSMRMDTVRQDLKYAARTLRRSPVFTTIAVASLALGIGASTAIFSLVDAALLRTLPVERAEELVVLGWRSPAGTELPDVRISGWYTRDDNGDGLSSSFSPPAFAVLRESNRVLSSAFAFSPLPRLNVGLDGTVELATGQIVSGNYYAALELRASRGRLLGEDDDRADAEPAVVVSHGYWQRRFAGADVIVGRKINVNGHPFVVVGVAPESFAGTDQVGSNPDLTIPLAMQHLVSTRSASLTDSGNWWLHVMGRLRPDVAFEAAATDLDLLFRRSVEADLFPAGVPDGITIPTIDLRDGAQGMTERRGRMRGSLATIAAVVALVLVIACVNVANLLLARAGSRRREVAVRLSIGATRWHLVRQLLTESLLLSVLAGITGVVFATWGRSLLFGAMVSRDLYIEGIETNGRVLFFGLAVSLVTGLAFGLVPAWRSSRPRLAPPTAGSASRLHRGGLWGPKSLMLAQIALSLPLLVVAGLFVRTLSNLEGQATGFDAKGVGLLSVDPRLNGYDGARQVAMYNEMQERIGAVPGVDAATVAHHSPLSDRISLTTLKLPGRDAADGDDLRAYYNIIGPGFFETFGIPLVAGRPITARDRDGGPMVAVINETFARRYFPGESALGKRFGLGRAGDPGEYEVVGVAADVKYQRPHDQWYAVAHVAHAQHADALDDMTLALRASGSLSEALAAAHAVVRDVDPDVPVFGLRTLDAQVALTLEQERLFARMSGILGAVALALACVGLYGILSYSIQRRRREIGVRMALGARTIHVVGLLVGEMRAVALGASVGLLASLAVTRYLESQLYELSTTDPLAMASATLMLVAVALLAAYLPARRASRVDPLVALRSE